MAAELRGNGAIPALLPAEAECVAGAVHKRRQEFAAGRSCARLALAALGYGPEPLVVGPDRSPIWPEGVTGSISHTSGYCIAAVACTATVRAVGIDAEYIGGVTDDLWDTLFVDTELLWLYRQARVARVEAATILFGAKEAFYKCQYSLTRAWLDFKDVGVSVTPGRFHVTVGKQEERCGRLGTLGRYVRDEDRILCTVVSRAEDHVVDLSVHGKQSRC